MLYFDTGRVVAYGKKEYQEEGAWLAEWKCNDIVYPHKLFGNFTVLGPENSAAAPHLFRFEIAITGMDPSLEPGDIITMQSEIGLALYTQFRSRLFSSYGYDYRQGLRKII